MTVDIETGNVSPSMLEEIPISEEADPSATVTAETESTTQGANKNVEASAGHKEGEGTSCSSSSASSNKRCGFFGWLDFHGVAEAKGYATLGTARGAVVMSNIFLSTSLIYLASEEAGCLDENGTVIDNCENTTHGFLPPTLIANIAVISGLLAAFFMPLIGAIVDYTPYRRATGIASAVLLCLIQATQIGTVSATWFPMAILQAIAGFIYQVQVLATYAYLPEIARAVGEVIMTQFTSTFVAIQFSAQALFLIVVIAISVGAGFNDVQTGQLSQAVNVIWISIGFYFGWKLLPSRPSRHVLPASHSVWTEGFKQVWRTAKDINRHYPHGLRWFLLATVFAEAGANAFTVLAVVFLDEQLGMSGTEIGVVFLTTLVASVPGAKLGSFVTAKTNPNTSWKINLVLFSVVTVAGAFALSGPDVAYLAYVFGVFWGCILGWFYSCENVFFSMVLPKGQEAELTGFFVYCTQILVWLPPLVFSIMIESGVSQSWGLISLISFMVVAIILLMFVAPWPDVLEESAKPITVHLAKAGEEAMGQDEDAKADDDEEVMGQDEDVIGVEQQP